MTVVYRLAFWFPLAGCTYLALIPNPQDLVGSWSDVALHMLAFSYLTAAVALAHFDFLTLGRGRWLPLGAMLAYGAWLEIAQMFTPGRSAELADLVVDVCGIAIGYVGYWAFHRLRGALAR